LLFAGTNALGFFRIYPPGEYTGAESPVERRSNVRLSKFIPVNQTVFDQIPVRHNIMMVEQGTIKGARTDDKLSTIRGIDDQLNQGINSRVFNSHVVA